MSFRACCLAGVALLAAVGCFLAGFLFTRTTRPGPRTQLIETKSATVTPKPPNALDIAARLIARCRELSERRSVLADKLRKNRLTEDVLRAEGYHEDVPAFDRLLHDRRKLEKDIELVDRLFAEAHGLEQSLRVAHIRSGRSEPNSEAIPQEIEDARFLLTRLDAELGPLIPEIRWREEGGSR